jgi:cytochrome oxidase Cu insertion factor (SCO1/SenC/PrrC family)
MNWVAIGLSAGSFVVVMATVVGYFATIPRGTVPVDVTSLVVKLLVGIGLAAASIVWGYQSASLGVAVIAPAAFAIMMASMVFFLLTQRKTPIGDIKVKVGDALLPFEATTSEGVPFHSDELAGKRTLLKFFRGGW